MALVLTASTKALNAEELLPQMCIFSGKTANIEERKFTVNKLNPWWVFFAVSCGLIGIIGLAIALRKSATITVPQGRGESGRWHWLRFAWFIPAYVMMVGLGVVAQVDGLQEPAVAIGILVLLVLSLALAGFGTWWYRTNMVRFELVGDKQVRIIFPDRLAEVHEAYSAALHSNRGDKWGGGRPRSMGSLEDDEWTEDVEPGWDDRKRPEQRR